MKVTFYAKFAALALLFVAVSGCLPDEDDDDPRLDWVGDWTCNETSGDFAPQVYNVSIDLGSGSDEIILRGLYNQGNSFRVEANVAGQNIDIPNQNIDIFTISGSGNINSNLTRIDLSFAINDGGGVDNVEAFLSR